MRLLQDLLVNTLAMFCCHTDIICYFIIVILLPPRANNLYCSFYYTFFTNKQFIYLSSPVFNIFLTYNCWSHHVGLLDFSSPFPSSRKSEGKVWGKCLRRDQYEGSKGRERMCDGPAVAWQCGEGRADVGGNIASLGRCDGGRYLRRPRNPVNTSIFPLTQFLDRIVTSMTI